MSEFDLSGDTSGTYGFDDSDSFSLGSENVSATGPSVGSSDTDRQFFGGSDATQNFAFDSNNPNIMDFGRGPVSNISDTSSFDPNFAALGMIGRGLTPGFDLRNQINFDVPSSMLPQLEGSRGPLAPKFYSPVERTLVEMEPVGLMALAGRAFESITSSFKDAKDTLGKMGNAVGGLSLSDLGIFSSTTGRRAMDDMTDNVDMNNRTFDMFGDRLDTRQISNFPQEGAQIPNFMTNPIRRIPTVDRGFSQVRT